MFEILGWQAYLAYIMYFRKIVWSRGLMDWSWMIGIRLLSSSCSLFSLLEGWFLMWLFITKLA